MKYGKIENGNLIYAPRRIVISGMQIFNPTAEHLEQAGYKEIRYTDIPEEPAPDGQYYESAYEDKRDYIEQVWELAEAIPEEPMGKTLEEGVTGLEQAVQSVEGAIERGLGV